MRTIGTALAAVVVQERLDKAQRRRQLRERAEATARAEERQTQRLIDLTGAERELAETKARRGVEAIGTDQPSNDRFAARV